MLTGMSKLRVIFQSPTGAPRGSKTYFEEAMAAGYHGVNDAQTEAFTFREASEATTDDILAALGMVQYEAARVADNLLAAETARAVLAELPEAVYLEIEESDHDTAYGYDAERVLDAEGGVIMEYAYNNLAQSDEVGKHLAGIQQALRSGQYPWAIAGEREWQLRIDLHAAVANLDTARADAELVLGLAPRL